EEREDCWTFYANRKYTDFDKSFKKSSDLDECKKTCFKTEYCYIVFEDTVNKECYYNVVDGEELDQEKFVVDENFTENYLTDCEGKDAGNAAGTGDESDEVDED
uniref:Saratin n=1 Tax=Haementeria officinalis TaxID=6410 RepID=D0VWW8_HAEOF|nr:Chain X, Saratin [Haementeria officinalis]